MLRLVWACKECAEAGGNDERHGYAERGLCGCCGARPVRVEWRPIDEAKAAAAIMRRGIGTNA